MTWRIEFDPRAVRELKKLDRVARERIITYLKQQISPLANPRSFGKSLMGDRQGLWRYRVGDYRIICELRDEVESVVVLKVGHRRSVYK